MKFYAVIDTNVFVSALITKNPQSSTFKILELFRSGIIVPMYNSEILEEYAEVLSRAKFRIDETMIVGVLSAVKAKGLNCERKPANCSIPDPEDIVFYEITLSREDAYLITGNLKHFPHNGRVVSPADMLQIIALAEDKRGLLCESEGPHYYATDLEDMVSIGFSYIDKIRAQSAQNGVSEMTLEEINEEIRLARAGKHH